MSKNQKGKGLGRGIDALFMNDLDTIDALEQVQDSEQIQQIAVSEIRPNTHINLVKSSMKRAWRN